MELLRLPARSGPGSRLALWALLLVATCLPQSGCVAVRAGARQYQDESTAVTITVATDPVVLAREVSMLAVNARDYVSLFPLEVNRSGQRRYYFYGYSWSTIDRRQTPGATVPSDDELTLQADDRTVVLRMSSRELQNAGLRTLPVAPPASGARPLLFPTDRATLLFVGTARALSAQFAATSGAASVEQFRQWSAPEPGFKGFFERIGSAQPTRTPSR